MVFEINQFGQENCEKLRPFKIFYPPPRGVDRNIVAHHPDVY